MTVKDNVHALLPSGHTPPVSAQNLRDAMDLVIDYVPTVAGTGGGGGTVVTGNAATFDTMATLQAATVDPAINFVRTAGYYAIGDFGGAVYRRKQSVEPTYALDRTSNGGTVRWELIPERMEIWLNQAGAKPPSTFNTQDNDCYPCFLAIDKFAQAKGLLGYTLRLDSGVYYSSKAWHFKRITTKVIGTANGSATGNGSLLRFPTDQCGLITNYKWGMGHDYMMALGNWFFDPANQSTIGRGICVYSGAGGGVPDGSCYRIVQGGTSPSTGATAITSVVPGVDITWGTVKLRYDGNIITDPVQGGGTMEYSCVPDDTASAGGCKFENLQLWGYFDPRSNQGTWKRNNAGIVMRIRGHISNVFALGFAGQGIAIVADGDPDLGGPGNANGTYLEHCSAYWNGKDGIHVGYSNANACTAVCIDVASNGRWGIADWTFLGNVWTGVESATDGQGFIGLRQYYPQCQYQGWVYMARLPVLGAESGWPNYINENPTTNSAAWIKYYKTPYNDLVNAVQTVTSTIAGTTGWITLGAAPSGKQTLTAAGVTSGQIIWWKITDGANWEIGASAFYAAGYDANTTADTIQRGAKVHAGDVGNIIASSRAPDANGVYPALTLSSSATFQALAVAHDYQNAAYWDPAIKFEPAGCYSTNNSNARSVWTYCYIEGGTLPAQWCWPTFIVGGLLNQSYDTTRGVFAVDDAKYTSMTVVDKTIGADNSSYSAYTSIGGGGQIIGWLGFNNVSYSMKQQKTNAGGSGFGGSDVILENTTIGPGQYPPIFTIRGPGSATLYGRSADGDWDIYAQPMEIKNLIVGGGRFSEGRLVQMGPSAPTTGYHAKGEFVLNNGTGADNTTFLWRCTASGTPGTWVART